MSNIHATAQVDPGAKLGSNVKIGAFCVVGPNVELGDDVVLRSHVVVEGHSSIGAGCQIYPFVTIGLEPQDVKYKDDPSTVTIGNNTLIREQVTSHRGTPTGHLATRVDSNCFLMIGAHIAHDCQIGDNVTMVNGVTLGGHVSVGDGAIIGGLSAVHQFVRIGACSFVGGMSGVAADLIPYGMALGNRANLNGLNIIGLKRKGFSRDQIHELRKAYRMLFSSEGTLKERLEDVEAMFSENELARQIIDFIESESDRSFCVPDNAATPSR
ncbi:MAG: acyl-ACP--UDP-N-acetylglucosamine O-acyltransferase [Pseudomonadota bacterium]